MDIIFDKSGFPMLKVEPENFWIHMWPVTKIQFENFLCEEPNSEMDASWYRQILANNPRVTPTKISTRNYWNLFVAGIHPEKVQLFTDWSGRGFSIPTSAEWYSAYGYLAGQDALLNLSALLTEKQSASKIDPLVGVISRKLQDVVANFGLGTKVSLADQLFMKRGMVEWVRLVGESGDWGGMGEPSPLSTWSTTSIVSQGRPEIVRNLNVRHYGFRLIKRG